MILQGYCHDGWKILSYNWMSFSPGYFTFTLLLTNLRDRVSWIQGNSKAVIWPTNRAVTWVTSTWPVLISKHTCIHTVHAVILDLSLHTNQVAHQARAYPSLSSMKWVGVFLLPSPPSWMGCHSITGLPPSSGVERTNHEANSIICNSKRIKIKWILSYTVYIRARN